MKTNDTESMLAASGDRPSRPRLTLPVRMVQMVKRMSRVVAYLGVLSAVVLFFYARTLRGQISEKTLVLERELSGFKDLLSGVHRIRLNEKSLFVASALSEQSMT